MTILETSIFCIIVFISGLVFGATGFGAATMFHLGYWTLYALNVVKNPSIAEVVVYLTLSYHIVAMGQSIFYWRILRFQLKFTIVYFIFIGIATVIGIELLIYSQGNLIMTRILGAILLLTFFIQVFKDYIFSKTTISKHQLEIDDIISTDIVSTIKKLYNNESSVDTQNNTNLDIEMSKTVSNNDCIHPLLSTDYETKIVQYSTKKEEDICTNIDSNKLGDIVKYELDSFCKYVFLIVACLVSGFFRGLFGSGGPPMLIYVLLTNIDRRVIRIVNTFALGYASGIPLIIKLLWLNGGFNPSQWVKYVLNFFAFLFGIITGNIIHKYVDQQMFRTVLLFLLLCGSISLILVDMDEVSMYSSLALTVVFGGLVLFVSVHIFISIKQAK
eukprot:55334_1